MIDHPLLLRPCYDEKIWGGRRLEHVLGKELPGEAPIGESLETGNGAVVACGPLAGRTLGELSRCLPEALLGTRGRAASAPFCDFPLLVKFIDAAEVLSVQVHPDDAAARPLGKRGKMEAWHVVASEPGAELITGMSRAAGPEEVREAIARGTLEDLLERRTVRPGESFMISPGTVHAIGAGVLLYEVQENSDITYRFYDWGRVDSAGRPRDLHLDAALDVMLPGARAGLILPLRLDDEREVLAACRYFALERWMVSGVRQLDPNGTTFRLLSCVAGAATIETATGQRQEISLGQTVLLPASLPLTRIEGDATLLCSSVPDLVADVVTPLLRAGHVAEEIARLDGGIGDLDAAIAVARPAAD